MLQHSDECPGLGNVPSISSCPCHSSHTWTSCASSFTQCHLCHWIVMPSSELQPLSLQCGCCVIDSSASQVGTPGCGSSFSFLSLLRPSTVSWPVPWHSWKMAIHPHLCPGPRTPLCAFLGPVLTKMPHPGTFHT